MSAHSQISATVSAATRNQLDRFTERYGLRKNFVVEQALLYYMEAREELPDEALTSAQLVLEPFAFDTLVDLIASPAGPTAALRELMHGHDY
jgi:hypothetical protein